MAIGDTLVIFTPRDALFSVQSRAHLGHRNQHPFVRFDNDVLRKCYFEAIMPANFNGTSFYIFIHYACPDDASKGAFYYATAIEKMTGLDINDDSFDSSQGEVVTPGTQGAIESTDEVDSDIDDIVAGDMFRLKFWRDPENVSDLNTGDVELHAIELRQ